MPKISLFNEEGRFPSIVDIDSVKKKSRLHADNQFPTYWK